MDGSFRMNTIKTIAIIGAMEQEIELLKNRLSNVQTHCFGTFQISEGTLHGKRIILSLSGIGKVNAAAATATVILKFTPDCVINTGSAGGLGKGLKIGDVVIGTHTAHHDVDVTAFGYVHGQVPQQPAQFESDEELVLMAENCSDAFEASTVAHGLIVSGDQFIHSSDKIATIRQHFPEVLAVEMEAAAIAQTCARFETPFVVIRAISDGADEKADISFDEFLKTAAVHSAEMVDSMIAAL